MTELDKFKRRLIRSVARLRLREKQTPDEMWATLRKETGRECKGIWNHMRILTVKKLSRLLAADDYADKLGKVARMTITDWLLFDMVLVHEQIDVISADKSVKASKLTALEDLFELVQHFKIETMSADPNSRAEAWAALVLKYNETGRECSPMLLQLRWYQLKKTSRASFYQFWHAFRGNKRLLPMAQQQFEPTPLQMAIAKRFTYLITEPFESWEELIAEKEVILLEHFIVLKRNKKSAIKEVFEQGCIVPPENFDAGSSNADGNDPEPDVVVLEPQIETITLAEDSDEEDSTKNTLKPVQQKQDTTQINEPLEEPINEIETALFDIIDKHTQGDQQIKVKKEPIERTEIPQNPEVDGLLNVEIIATTHVPTEEIYEPSDYHETDPATKQLELLNSNHNAATEATLVKSEIDCFIEENAVINEEAPDIDKQLEELEEAPNVNSFVEGINFTNTENSVDDDLEDMDDPIIRIDFDSSSDVKTEIKETKPIDITNPDSSNPIGELPSNLEFLDDGIDMDEEYGDEDDNENQTQPDLAEESTSSQVIRTQAETSCDDQDSSGSDDDKDEAQSPKFDLKLMMLPVVYSTKLEHMKTFQDKDVEAVETADLINIIFTESKPFSTKSVNITPRVEPVENKVLLLTKKEKTISDDLITLAPGSDEDIKFIDSGINNKTKMEIQEKILTTQEKHNDDDMIKLVPEDEEEYESSEEKICEDQKVKPTSNMFKKPRTRNYTPIQLCKNPDFNTRLKKLSIGFFTSERNRQLLTACKPLTIDLHKSFESKLVDNTIYFKSSFLLDMPQTIKEEPSSEEHLASVIPSAMPAQCLINQTTKVDIEDLLPANSNQEDEVLIAERNKNKVINLPDIQKVRRLNQHLATAEVSPIQVKNTGMLEISPLISSYSVQSEICVDDQTDINTTLHQIKNELVAEERDSLQSEARQPGIEKITDDNFEVDVVNTDLNKSEDECCYGDGDAYDIKKRKREIRVQKFREYMEMHEKPPPLVTCLNPESAKEILDPAYKTSKSNKNSLRGRNKPEFPWYSSSYVPPKLPKQSEESDSKVVKKLIGESLLTLDTLNKMLTLLHGSQVEDVYGDSKKKNVTEAPLTDNREILATDVVDLDEKEDIDRKEAEQQKAVQSIETPPPLVLLNEEPLVTKIIAKVRVINNRPNKPPRSSKTVKNIRPRKLKPPTTPKGTLCCWAREKIMALEMIPTKENNTKMHRCTVENRLCVCCCVKDLLEFSFRSTAISDDCCWAREKLINLQLDGNTEEFLKPHRCAIECRQCDCCCIKDLVLFETDHLPVIVGINRPSPKPSPSKKLSNTNNEIESALNVLSAGSSETQTVESSVPCVTVVLNTELDFVPKTTNPIGLRSDPEKDACGSLIDDAEIHTEANIENVNESSANVSTDLNKSADSEQFILLSDDDNDCDSSKTIVGDARCNQDRGSVMDATNYQQTASLPVMEIIDNIIDRNQEVLQTPKADVSQYIKILPKTHHLSNVCPPENILPTQSVGSEKSTLKRKVWKTKYVIRCAKSQSTCPINMGEGKILLTNAKIPIELLDPDIEARTPNTDNANVVLPQPPQQLLPCISIPGFPMPKGVSLILAPNGDVSCVTEPGVQLDPSLRLKLEAIIENLQIQLHGSTPILVPNRQGDVSIMSDHQSAVNVVNIGCTKESVTESSAEDTKSTPLVESTEKIDNHEKKTGANTPKSIIETVESEEAESYSMLNEGINEKSDVNTQKSEEEKKTGANTPESMIETVASEEAESHSTLNEGINEKSDVNLESEGEKKAGANTPESMIETVASEEAESYSMLNEGINEKSDVITQKSEGEKKTGANTPESMIETVASEEAESHSTLYEGINKTSDVNIQKPEGEMSPISETQKDQCDKVADTEVEKNKPCDDAVVSVLQKRSADLEKEMLIESYQEGEQKNQKSENQAKEEMNKKLLHTHEPETENIRIPETNCNEPTENINIDKDYNAISENLRDEKEYNSEHKEPSDQIIEIPKSGSAKKSILSDLMEMSGISSEDALPAPEHNLEFYYNPAPPAPNIQELTQVTTLSLLKYAHQQNARFFKYDVANGTMVAIKVSIEKVQKNPAPPVTKAIIDLTDDPQPEGSRVPVSKPKIPRICRKRAKLNNSKKIEARVKANPENRSLLRQNVKPTLRQTRNRRLSLDFEKMIQSSCISTKKSRKPKIEARIHLDDSDGPMEEEYLVDSSSDSEMEKDFKTSQEKYINNLRGQKRPLETYELDDDSSDDEPLAKKVLRKRSESRDATVILDEVENPDVDMRTRNDTLVPIGEPEPTDIANITAAPVLFEDNASQDGSDDFILGA